MPRMYLKRPGAPRIKPSTGENYARGKEGDTDVEKSENLYGRDLMDTRDKNTQEERALDAIDFDKDDGIPGEDI